MTNEQNKPARQTAFNQPASKQRSRGVVAKKSAITGQMSGGEIVSPSDSATQWPLIGMLVILALGIWSYGPTLLQLLDLWSREPDYSHGYFVVPLSLYFLWIRRKSFPGFSPSSPLLAIGLLSLSLGMRYAGGRYFYTFLDGWSLLPWVAAMVAAAGGLRLLVWSLPSIGFLFFMLPLPYSLEGGLSGPLQRIATKLSCVTLQTLGFSAFADGNVILLGNDRFEVAQACSGLRLFISILALSYAYIVIVERSWWEKLVIALAAVPVAILSNAGRIVATAVLYQFTTNEQVRHFAHDSAGWATILLAAAMLWVLLRYFQWLIQEEEIMDTAALVRGASIARHAASS